MALSRITEAVASFTDLTIADDLTLSDDLLMASDVAKISFGADADVSFTHVHNTGLLLNSTSVIQFNDASQNIGAPSATVLDINATDEIELNATLVDVNANLDVSGTITGGGLLTTGGSIVIPNAGTIGSASDTDAIAIASNGVVSFSQDLDIEGAIDVNGTTNLDVVDIDGAVDMASTLQVDGAITGSSTIVGTTITATTAFVPDASDGAALGTTALEFSDLFLADGAVISLGDDDDVTLTHVADTGILLNSTNKIQFNDASQFIHAPSATVLDIAATDEIELTATLIDVVGNLAVSGNLNLAGDLEVVGSSSTTVTASGAVVPDANDGATLGTAALAFADIFLADAATIQLGNDEEITITHVHNSGITLTNTVNGTDDSPIVLQLKSEEDAIVADDVIASIEMAAGDSDGTDGATVAAGIHAIAEGTFSASANATKLVFTTGVSETAAASATAKMTLSSAGLLTIADDLIIKDAGTIGSASDPDAIAIGSDGDVTLTQDLELQHDGAILSFGANDEVSLTHVHDTGLLLNTTMKLQFRDAAIHISSTADGDLSIAADDEIDLTSTLIDINGNATVSGTLGVTGIATFTDDIIIGDGKTIGVASDVDVITIASTGVTTFSKGVVGATSTDTSNTGNVALDFATFTNFVLTFTGNVTLTNPTTEVVGQSGFIVCIQDGTGSRTLSLGTDYETAGSGGITLSTDANARDIIPYAVSAAGSVILGAVQKAFG